MSQAVLVPQEVRELMGSVMRPEALEFWWTTPLTVFQNCRPYEIWKVDRKRVIEFIQSRKAPRDA